MIHIKTAEQIELIRQSGHIIAEIFRKIKDKVREGITTEELDEEIGKLIRRKGAFSAFKNYRGYPKNSCISLNEEVVHGIPSPDRRIKEGDIVSVDIGISLDGYIADAAKTFPVGKISEEKTKLLKVTEDALYGGIKQMRTGKRVGDISWAIQKWVEKNGFSVVKVLFGHGVGYSLHEDPPVPNFGKARQGESLREGIVLAIEPMVNAGGDEVKVLDNRWTVATVDGKPSAHFEHTVAVVDGRPKILTI